MTVQEHLTEKTFSHFSLGRKDKKRNKIIIKAKMRDPSKNNKRKILVSHVMMGLHLLSSNQL